VAIRTPTENQPDFLPPQTGEFKGRKTLVLDLDETLVHSTFTPPRHGERRPDIILNIEWDNGERDYVFVKVRPFAFTFLIKMSKIFEVVIFTASISNYAFPLIRNLDKKKINFPILSRRQCTLLNGCYYKDLSRLGRKMNNVIMLDNSPEAYAWQKENGIPIISWFDDVYDSELKRLVPILERLAQVDDVREYIPKIVGKHSVNYYEALRALKAPRESSPLDSIFTSLTKFKKGAARFFSGKTIDEVSIEKEESKSPKHRREFLDEEEVILIYESF
jgi:Dullard-like phosphatase family protein